VDAERRSYEKALNWYTQKKRQRPGDLKALCAARSVYLDALRVHTSNALYASECLLVGGWDRFLQILPLLTVGQVTMLLRNSGCKMPPEGPVVYLLFIEALEHSGKVDPIAQTPLQGFIKDGATCTPEVLATAFLSMSDHSTTKNTLYAALQAAGWTAHKMAAWAHTLVDRTQPPANT
jgi:hypothetical protein